MRRETMSEGLRSRVEAIEARENAAKAQKAKAMAKFEKAAEFWTRNDRGHCVEWVCEHGCGHPDPRTTKNTVHGCDGCCSRADFPPTVAEATHDESTLALPHAVKPVSLWLRLPWPESVNHLYGNRYGGRGKYMTPAGKAFMSAVAAIVYEARCRRYKEPQLLTITMLFYPPDRKRRDEDNLLKQTLDSLEKAGLVDNDHQFADKILLRREVVAGGEIVVRVQEWE